jgi:hypothetical protein
MMSFMSKNYKSQITRTKEKSQNTNHKNQNNQKQKSKNLIKMVLAFNILVLKIWLYYLELGSCDLLFQLKACFHFSQQVGGDHFLSQVNHIAEGFSMRDAMANDHRFGNA